MPCRDVHTISAVLVMAQVIIDGDSREFYEEAAAAAASLAVCIDLYVASPAAAGLRCLEPLAVSSGGVAYLYPSLVESALPQVLLARWLCTRLELPALPCCLLRHSGCSASRAVPNECFLCSFVSVILSCVSCLFRHDLVFCWLDYLKTSAASSIQGH